MLVTFLALKIVMTCVLVFANTLFDSSCAAARHLVDKSYLAVINQPFVCVAF